jgi:uncharacterized protein YdeI (YjbR/CyaY-like superfamily)
MMNDKLEFTDRSHFRDWLLENYQTSSGIWILFPKTKETPSVKPNEALEEALCFGWIDGQIKRIDDEYYQKRFTPRRKGSPWSERNKKLARALIENGLMKDPGLRAIEQAKKDGTWQKGYKATVSEDQVRAFGKMLDGYEPALTNFLNMSPSVKKTYTAFYLDAKKEETKKKRLKKIVERLSENKKPM